MNDIPRKEKNAAFGNKTSNATRRPARVELIWDGKYDDAGRRVAPLRVALPFQMVETVNESAQDRQRSLQYAPGFGEEEWRNRLIWGDKKYVLPSLLAEFAGKVNLIYIDPPFDTGSDFSFTATVPDDPETPGDDSFRFTKEPSIIEQKAYRDTWGRGLNSYLQWFYESAALLYELLHEQGSIFVHLDSNAVHYAKVILDEIFGSESFRNQIAWKRQSAHSDTKQGSQHFGRISDTLLFYAKSSQLTWNAQYAPYDPEYVDRDYRRVDADGRRYRIDNLQGPGGAEAGNPYYEVMGVSRHWRYSKEKMEELIKQGRVIQTRPGAVPQYKRYLDEMPGVRSSTRITPGIYGITNRILWH